MKYICIGRNYAQHAKELGNDIPKEPLIFLKPDSATLKDNEDFFHPDFSDDIHYEVELLVKINKLGKNIPLKFASKYYDTIGLGIDFTARDIQSICKQKGQPWEKAKAFDQSAVVSTFISKNEFDLSNLDFELHLNNNIVQKGNTSEMIFNIDQIISYISSFMTLKKGDIIFTGTPQGVGKINIGDQLSGFIKGQEMFNFKIK